MPFAVSDTQTRPSFAPHPEITLVLARVHEVCGSARRTFALWLASRMQGPVIWITPGWIPDQLNPEGMTAFADPGRFIFVRPRRYEDLLWCIALYTTPVHLWIPLRQAEALGRRIA